MDEAQTRRKYELFPWPLLRGGGAPVVRAAPAAATQGALPVFQALPQAHGDIRSPRQPGGVGVAHADFTSQEAGPQRGRVVFPQP